MSKVRVRVDREAGMSYIYIAENYGTIAHTKEVGGVNLDFDIHGNMVGIELFSAVNSLEFIDITDKDSK